MRISDWSSDVCSSDLDGHPVPGARKARDADRHLSDDRRLPRPRPAGAIHLPRPAEAARLHADHLERRPDLGAPDRRSEEHTSELQSLMRISYAVFCLKKKKIKYKKYTNTQKTV